MALERGREEGSGAAMGDERFEVDEKEVEEEETRERNEGKRGKRVESLSRQRLV